MRNMQQAQRTRCSILHGTFPHMVGSLSMAMKTVGGVRASTSHVSGLGPSTSDSTPCICTDARQGSEFESSGLHGDWGSLAAQPSATLVLLEEAGACSFNLR